MPKKTFTRAELAKMEAQASTHSLTRFRDLVDLFGERPNILGVADSWGAYPSTSPLDGRPSNIFDHVEKRTKRKVNFLRLTRNGAEMTEIMSASHRHRITSVLKRYSGLGKPFSILLISGGGNDIVGKHDMERFLLPSAQRDVAKNCIDWPMLNLKLKQIRLAYEELLSLRNRYSPETWVIGHTYDIPFLTGKPTRYLGAKMAGPWVTPAMDDRQVPDHLRAQVVDLLFKAMRKSMETLPGTSTARGKFLLAQTQGTLTRKSQWRDEIHPTSGGFKLIAAKVYSQMRRAIPELPAW